MRLSPFTIHYPTASAGPACDLGVISSFNPSRIVHAMTIVIGLLDPGGEVLVATDSRASDEKTMTLRDGVLKSVRINDKCAIAFAGQELWANNLIGNLFELPQAQTVGSEDILDYVEKNELTLDEDPFAVAYRIRCIFNDYRRRAAEGQMEIPALNAVIVATDERDPYLTAWARKWDGGQVTRNRAVDKAVFQVFGPGGPKEAKDVLSDLSIPIWERIRKAAQICRDICPCGVNLDVSVRRAADGFRLKKLSDFLAV